MEAREEVVVDMDMWVKMERNELKSMWQCTDFSEGSIECIYAFGEFSRLEVQAGNV